MIMVSNEVKIYEIGVVEERSSSKVLLVSSHWNRDCFVVLKLCDIEYTVAADDLKAAIENATNSSR